MMTEDEARVIPFPAAPASALPSWCAQVRLRGRIPAVEGTIRARAYHHGEWHYDVMSEAGVIRDVPEREIERT